MYAIRSYYELRRAAILHDLGKIGITETILNKPAKLTREEFREVIRHPEVGTQIRNNFV